MAAEYIDRFDNPAAKLPGASAAGALVTPQASPQATPQFIDRFDQPATPQADPMRFGTAMPELQVPSAEIGVPRQPAWPPSQELRQQPPDSVSYNPTDPGADNFGGDAGFLTTMKASLVPETSPENMRKQFRIYSRDMGIPEDRFFLDNEGNPAWIDLKGNKHLVVPTVGGGDWKQPLDMARRVGAAVGDNVGASVAPVVGGGASMVAGPLAGAATAGAADLGRQALGNYFAGSPLDDLDYGNAAWQAAGVGTAELAGQVGASVATRLTQKNPYNLRDGEIRELQQQMPLVRNRANTATQLNMQTTPYDLAGTEALRRLEQTVSKQPGWAGDIMKAYYDQRSDFNFPNAVGNLFGRISKEGVPAVGLDKLKRGAENTLAHIRDQQVNQGVRGGWGEAIASGVKPDIRPAVAEIQARLPHASGPVKAELERILKDLHDPVRDGGHIGAGSLITDFEKLHNIRLDLEGSLEGLRRTLPPSQRGRMTEVLEPIYAKFNAALEAAHPNYAAGTEAYSQAGNAAADLRDGVLTLLSRDPEVGGKLSDVLFNADAETVKRARQLFIAAGQGDAWDAGTRAFLENNLLSSRGPNVAGGFSSKSAPFDSHRIAIDEALPDEALHLTRDVLDIGRNMGRVRHPANRAEVENVRLEEDRVGRGAVSQAVRAALSPFRFTKELGDDIVSRAFNANAAEMALKLTGHQTPKPPGLLRRMAGVAPRAVPPQGTPQVLENLEATTLSPFGGWQRHLLERAIANGGGMNAVAYGRASGLLGQQDPTEPTAEDLRRGLLNMR